MSFAIGRLLLRSHQLSVSVSVSPSVRPRSQSPYPPPIPPPPAPSLVQGGEAEFPIQVSFVLLSGEGSLVLALSQARSLILALDRVRAHSRQGQGRERTTRDEDRQHGEPDQVARCKRARAGPCRSPGLGQRRTLEAPTLPSRAAPPPNETDQALGCVVIVLVFPPQFPAGVGNSLPGGRPGSALSVRRNKRLVCLGRCSCCSLGERLKQGPF